MINIKNVNFITSAASPSGFVRGGGLQIAVAGKSNVGKSSFINMLVNRNGAARVSGTPGRTRLINYFSVDTNAGGFVLTDLPGYGFARVSKEEKEGWGRLVESYFDTTENAVIFVLVDIRHLPSADDVKLIEYLYYKAVPFYIVANKSDKQSRQANMKSKREIAAALKIGIDDIILVSCLNKAGREDVLNKIEELIAANGERERTDTAE
ncbi:MAG: ribosome biogenesis GTP-binding protein YihA/YsxC [Clostridiales bacterium]|jgi:GTP-binding protein|nr:ribosome biogenesis GTP-binding protein YihA/YsxC [Clostridiales bacterium]